MSDISSLGIGSGVLTADVIDQLKAADESRIIKPMDNKVTLNNQKQDAFTLLSSLMTSFKANASALSYDTIFDGKTVDVSGNAEVTIDAGATVESFTLETVALAKKDISQFGAAASTGGSLATSDGTLTIKVGSDPLNPDKTLSVSYTSGMSLDDLTQAITDQAGDDVSASVLQTGDGAYSLVLSSKTTGENQTLTISDDGGLAAITADYQKIQSGSDATFKYNGITATRSTNEIDDLILGVNITLKEEGDISSVDVAQDTTAITDELQLFVDSYNTLMSNINDMTIKDEETGAEGVFNSDSFVKSISRELTKTVTALTGNDSLVNYGIDLDRSGIMSFDKSALEEKLADDADAVKLFFTGGTNDSGNDVTGIFQTIDEKLKSYTGYGQLLSNFETDLKNDGENLTQSRLRAQESLNTRYEIMTRRFIAYDSMISKVNSQFSSLQMMIDSELG